MHSKGSSNLKPTAVKSAFKNNLSDYNHSIAFTKFNVSGCEAHGIKLSSNDSISPNVNIKMLNKAFNGL